jgi:hypothetical protein
VDARTREWVSGTVPENVVVFDRRAEEHDRWFSENEYAYASELKPEGS